MLPSFNCNIYLLSIYELYNKLQNCEKRRILMNALIAILICIGISPLDKIPAVKIIAVRLINECIPSKLLIALKCIMLTEGIIAPVATSVNPLTRNMIFFRKDSMSVSGYSLHSYILLNDKKSKQLEADQSIF